MPSTGHNKSFLGSVSSVMHLQCPSQLRFDEAVLFVRVQVRDSRSRRVGRCKEWAKVVGDDQVDARVLAMRHKDLPYVPKLQKATKPERVMTYRSALLCELV